MWLWVQFDAHADLVAAGFEKMAAEVDEQIAAKIDELKEWVCVEERAGAGGHRGERVVARGQVRLLLFLLGHPRALS